MADLITKYSSPSSATPSLVAYFYNNGAEIDSTGDYVKTTGVALTSETFSTTTRILDADDIFCGLVTATIDQIRIKEGATERLRFDLATDEVFAVPTDFTYPWPSSGVTFRSGGFELGIEIEI